MNFINDKEKMVDIFLLTKTEFLNSYSYLTEEEYENTLDIIWQRLGDIPVDKDGITIEQDFYVWKKGTKKEEIWKWFDIRLNLGIGNRYFN